MIVRNNGKIVGNLTVVRTYWNRCRFPKGIHQLRCCISNEECKFHGNLLGLSSCMCWEIHLCRYQDGCHVILLFGYILVVGCHVLEIWPI